MFSIRQRFGGLRLHQKEKATLRTNIYTKGREQSRPFVFDFTWLILKVC
jgi:hypothetical protein